jgi:hypothetical protein
MMPLYDKMRERLWDYAVQSANATEVGDRPQAIGEGYDDIGKEHRLYNELKC